VTRACVRVRVCVHTLPVRLFACLKAPRLTRVHVVFARAVVVTRACVRVRVCDQDLLVRLFALLEALSLTRVHADVFVRSRW
jgi:hypothetical protein